MTLPNSGWKNKGGTSVRSCKCGSWKDHWIKHTGKEWPSTCSVEGCSANAELGAHLYNSGAKGEWIAPLCTGCNNTNAEFTLKGGISLVPANQSETCAK